MRAKGSITVFSAMSLMLITSLLFALLESARSYGLQLQGKQKAMLVTESVFAEYQEKIWKDYHLLFLDGAYGGEEFELSKIEGKAYQLFQENVCADSTFARGGNLLQMQGKGATVDAYQLATDGQGEVFFRSVVSYMKQTMPQKVAQELYERITKGETVQKENSDCEKAVEKAKNSMQEFDETEKAGEESKSGKVDKTDTAGRSIERDEKGKEEKSKEETNILEYVLKMKQNAVLGLVVEDISKISDTSISLKDTLLNRNFQKGNMAEKTKGSWYDNILFTTYLTSHFLDYTQNQSGKVLSYELEYLLCGKESDKANLESTVGRLLLIREASNVASIMKDPVKLKEASAVAITLAGYTGNPAIIKMVELGIIAAWAYLEGILDVRTLLGGGRIPFVKTSKEWTLDVKNMLGSFQESKKAKESKNGVTYQEYLAQLLFAQNKREVSYRAMDLIEKNIQQESGYENLKMEHMIVKAKLSYEWDAEAIFWNLMVLDGTEKFSYSFLHKVQFSYQT